MNDVTLLLVMGLPGAGKTTLCEQLTARLSDRMEVIHIAFDSEIDESVFTAFEESRWKEERSRVLQAVRAKVSQMRGSDTGAWRTCGRSLLLLDDNFYYRSMRQPIYQLAKDYGCSLVFLVVDTNAERCIERDAMRPRPVGEKVINKMKTRFERPNPAVCPWERFCHFVSEISRIDWSLLESLLEECRAHPLSREAEILAASAAAHEREVCKVNLRHQADLMLRKIFKDQISKDTLRPSPERISELKAAREEVLSAIRSGDLVSAEDVDLATEEGHRRLRDRLCVAFVGRLPK